MKELKIGEVFVFLGTQYLVCGYNSVEGIIQSIDIWPFTGDPNEIVVVDRNAALGCPMAEPTCPAERALKKVS